MTRNLHLDLVRIEHLACLAALNTIAWDSDISAAYFLHNRLVDRHRTLPGFGVFE